MAIIDGKKRCPKCGKTQSVIAFSVSRRSSDGLQGWCKACVSIANKRTAEKWKALRAGIENGGQK